MGGWNQLTLYPKFSYGWALAAIVAVAAGAWVNRRPWRESQSSLKWRSLGVQAMVSLGGLGAANSIALAATQYQGWVHVRGAGRNHRSEHRWHVGPLRTRRGRWEWVAPMIWPLLMAILLGRVIAVHPGALRGP